MLVMTCVWHFLTNSWPFLISAFFFLTHSICFGLAAHRLIGRMPDSSAKAEMLAAMDCTREAAEVRDMLVMGVGSNGS